MNDNADDLDRKLEDYGSLLAVLMPFLLLVLVILSLSLLALAVVEP